MTTPTKPDHMDDELEQILDTHAEYYIRETMKFFQENGVSPALSKNNDEDLAAKAAIKAWALREVLLAAKPTLNVVLAETEEEWAMSGKRIVLLESALRERFGDE